MRHADESAVSAVVGAVLLTALFASAMTIYVVQTLPDWKADKEHNQQLLVQAQMTGLRSDIEALAARRDTGPVTSTIPLETPRVALLQGTPARATLGLQGGFDVGFSYASSPQVYLEGGAAVATPGTAVAICSGLCITSFDALVLGVTMSSAGTGTLATALLTDSNGDTVTATLSHTQNGGSCSGEVRLTVAASATGQSLVTPLLCTGSATVTLGAGGPFRLDLLDSRFGMSSLVDRLAPPMSLGLSSASATVGHALVYEDSSGVLRVTGTGVTNAAPVADILSQRLTYEPNYFAFPNQRLILEGGAVIAEAGSTRQALVGDAPFTLDVAGGLGSLTWTLTDLQGEGGVGGGREATVSATFDSIEDIVFRVGATGNCAMAAPCATIVLDTETAAAWGNFIDLQAGLAGLSDSADATVDAGAGTMTLRLGSDTGLTVTQGWVIHLRIIHATLDVS